MGLSWNGECPNGHNLLRYGTYPDKHKNKLQPVLRCRECNRQRAKAYRQKLKLLRVSQTKGQDYAN